MGFINSLKKLFGTSKEAATVKSAEIKEKAADTYESAKEYTKTAADKLDDKLDDMVDDIKEAAITAKEKVKEFGENLKDKTEDVIEKLDDKAACSIL